MLSNKKIECPENLLNLAKIKGPLTAGIISAGNDLAMKSAHKATKMSLIKPIFIGLIEALCPKPPILNNDNNNI